MAVTYSISAVAEATGLSTHTIRAWERRYGILNPDRSGSNRRLYNQEDVERLRMLKRATDSGHSISLVAQLPEKELAGLVRFAQSATPRVDQPIGGLERCITAMRRMDEEDLKETLARSAMVLGVDAFLATVVLPLISELDRGWSDGTVSVYEEHLVSACLRVQLDRVRATLSAPPDAPRIIITTPSGQLHELGALLAALAAARSSWNVTYLGPNLPAEEIYAAVRQTSSKAVALSLVYPLADPLTVSELLRLRGLLGQSTPIVVGGRATSSYEQILSEIDAHILSSGAEFAGLLRSLV